MSNNLTIVFAPLNAWGHINACAAIGSELKEKFGYRIIFIINPSWKGRLTQFGFEEEIYSLNGNSGQGNPSQDWTDLVTRIGPNMRQSSLEKIKSFGLEAQQGMVKEIMESNAAISEILNRVAPNLIVVDNYVLSPALVSNSGIPWIRLRSASPLEINPTNVPPQNSGYCIQNGDATEWEKFTNIQNETYKPLWEMFSSWFTKNSGLVLPPNYFMLSSPHLNLYLYPSEIDYTDRRPMPENWIRIDALVRNPEKCFDYPQKLMFSFYAWKTVYLSLGTFGSADLTLMTKIVDFLRRMPIRVIVSKGPFHYLYDLPQNMWGQASLPQTEILPIVDGVICHGGNATMNECFYFGKPMIILPILGDEYDNAQRILEMGFGARLDPYNFTFDELRSALDLILEDPAVIEKMTNASVRIQNSNGPSQAAEHIMSVMRK